MALFITTADSAIEWHVGQRLPFAIHEARIEEIQADGDELVYARSMFGGVVTSESKKSETWLGPFARVLYLYMWADYFHKSGIDNLL